MKIEKPNKHNTHTNTDKKKLKYIVIKCFVVVVKKQRI